MILPMHIFAGEGDKPQEIQITYYNWIHNDIVRNVEEIRRAREPYEKRDLVEDIEQIIYDKIEFPLSYQQAEMTDSFDLDRIGVTSDVTESKEANPLAPEIAEAYALLGIAKGYEGFGAAAADLFKKATTIYANVMNMTVSLDHNQDNRTLSQWVSASRGYWGNSTATRCTFFGKRISQEVVDMINTDTLDIVKEGGSPDYTMFVARRDFVRGLKRYILTDDTLKEAKPNKFMIYLPPGVYRLKTAVSGVFEVEFKVSRNVTDNNYIIETLRGGISVYPIPDIKIFEDEMRKKMLEAQKQKQGDSLPGEDTLDDLGIDDNMGFGDELDVEPLPEPPLE